MSLVRSLAFCNSSRQLVVAFCTILFAGSALARPVPQNLGNGLDKLVESNLILRGKIDAPAVDESAKPNGTTNVAGKNITTYDGYATRQAANYARAAITDPVSKQFMVDIVLGGSVRFDKVKDALTNKFASLKITAMDPAYRGTGVIEGYVSLDDVPALAQTPGVRSVHLSLRPHHSKRPGKGPAIDAVTALGTLGTAFDQGVTQHRVDKINRIYTPSAPLDYEGTGMSIGFLSDSFNTSGTGSYTTDVANRDLPGAGNPTNSQPVVVLEEGPSGATDEGRGMVQIGYKMAPKARLAFATADTGEVGFANNIRALAALPGFTKPPAFQQGFRADVICDDVGYFDEPYFQTGIIGNGIDDVYAAGVSYFSSAANDIGINGYDSDLRIVPNGTGLTAATNTALMNTNINLANVPANLYAGGFHNFDSSGDSAKQDVAQTVNVPTSADLAQFLLTNYFLIFQWDDAYDPSSPVLGPLIYTNTGNINGTTTMSITYDNTSTPPLPTFTQGQEYVITEKATSGDFDGIISVIDPNGNTLLTQDTGTDEVVTFFAPASGQFKIKVDRFASTAGSFTLDVNTANGTPLVTTDLNLLVFDVATGAFISSKSLTANNVASNRPVDVESIMGDNSSQLQFVIARGNTPGVSPQPATHVRYVLPGNGLPNLGPAEHFNYNAPTTGGHAIAAGCNGTAAYSVFRPSIPEYFTSPGPGTIYFDKNNNRLNPPEVRQQPSVAAADGGNTSFFGGDSNGDSDSKPNFFGTSAAAPHAAAIAALVLQAHGGFHSVTPAQMTAILHSSAFLHDLDPLSATGTAATTSGGVVTVTIRSDNEAQTGTGEKDPNSISVSYVGPGHIATLNFNPNGLASEGGNVTGGNNGVDATNTYFSNLFPGVVFLPASVPFTVGTTLPNSLAASDVVALPSNAAPAPSNGVSQYWTLGLQFPTGNFTSGKALHFTIGRGEQHSSDVENLVGQPVAGTTIDDATGDIWGGGVLIPEGTLIPNGMKFSGTMDDGSSFTGRIVNQIGHGYTPLDGYGFLNAEAAVGTPLPPPVQYSAVSRKTHDTAGTFDIDLPSNGSGIECRSGGTNGDYKVVFVFPTPLSSVGSAFIASGAGAITSKSIQNGGTECVVNLTNVANAQKSVVTLNNVIDTAGNSSASISATLGVLIGDTTANGFVNSGDVSLTQAQSGQPVTGSNFREDVTANGFINSADVSVVQSKSGTSLP
jgi:subtilase family protein